MSSGGFQLDGPGRWRRIKNAGATAAATLSAVLVILPLLVIFSYLVVRGIGALNLAFLTHAPVPVGELGGGVGNAIVGSAIILVIASLIGVPLGIGAGIYLSEYGRTKFGNVVRFTADILNGLPSIVIGIGIYGLVVVRQKHFSAFAGGVALGEKVL